MQENKNLGYMAALGCYVLWGILPLYWHLMADAEANEILCHRILWSVVFMLIVLKKVMPKSEFPTAEPSDH
jgi:chloramphenicol-sensitive protein RarD